MPEPATPSRFTVWAPPIDRLGGLVIGTAADSCGFVHSGELAGPLLRGWILVEPLGDRSTPTPVGHRVLTRCSRTPRKRRTQGRSADAASRNIPTQGHFVDRAYCLGRLVVAWGQEVAGSNPTSLSMKHLFRGP